MADKLVTENSTRSNVEQLIEAFKIEQTANSITPARAGELLKKILDLSKEEENILEEYIVTLKNETKAPALIGTINLSDLDSVANSSTSYMTGTAPSKMLVKSGNANVGLLDIISDPSLFLVTEIFTTHYELKDGSFVRPSALGTSNNRIYTYYRSWVSNMKQGTNWKQSADGGNMILDWSTDIATTRKSVLNSFRKPGLIIAYRDPEKGWVTEQYTGSAVTDAQWALDSNWQHIATSKDVTDGIKGAITSEITDPYGDSLNAGKGFFKKFDGKEIAEKSEDYKYISLDGQYASASVTASRLYAIKNRHFKSIYAYLRANADSLAISFFSGDYKQKANYITDSGVKGINGANFNKYYTDVPETADYIVICSSYQHDLSEILLFMTPEQAIDVEAIFDDVLLSEGSKATTATANIDFRLDLTSYKKGTKFRLDLLHADNIAINYYTGDGRTYKAMPNVSVSEKRSLYFEKDSDAISQIRLYHAPSEAGDSVSYKFYLTRDCPSREIKFLSYTPASLPVIRNLGWFVGYWQNNSGQDVVYQSKTFICSPVQFINNVKLNAVCDFSVYYITVAMWFKDMSGFIEVVLTSENNSIDLSDAYAWHIAVRRQDRADISSSLEQVLSDVSFIIEGDDPREKPLTHSEFRKEKKSILENSEAAAKEVISSKGLTSYIYNPFIEDPHYYHFSPNGFLNDRNGNHIIASQSVEDVEIASRLGFKYIEANIHKTSDGGYVCIHGENSSGPYVFGVEVEPEYQNKAIDSLTSEFIRKNVRYASTVEKYKSNVASLEDFCAACRKNGIGIFAGTSDKGAIEICQRLMGDALIVYGPPSDIRDYFNGYVLCWNNNPGTSPDTLLSQAIRFGPPFMCGLGPALLKELTDKRTLDGLIKEMHANNFLIGVTGVYDTEGNIREAMRRGCDFNCSGHDVNPFVSNYELLDLELSADGFNTEGTYTDGVLTLSPDQTLKAGSGSVIPLGKGELRISFEGKLRISFGSRGYSQRELSSDGSETLILSDYFLRRNTELNITAIEQTKIKGLVYKTSRC